MEQSESLGISESTLTVLNRLLSIWHAHRMSIFLFLLVGAGFGYLLARKRSNITNSRILDSSNNIAIGEQQVKREFLHATTLISEKTISEKSDPGDHTSTSNGTVQLPPRVKAPQRRVTGSKTRSSGNPVNTSISPTKIQPIIYYFSLGGSTKHQVLQTLRPLLEQSQNLDAPLLSPKIYDLAVLDYEDFFEHLPTATSPDRVRFFYILAIPSYNFDTTLDAFLNLLKETHNDFRIDTAPLSDIAGYSVFGFGDQDGWPTEADGFCTQAVEVDKWMARLTNKKRAFPLGLGDVKTDANQRFLEWGSGLRKCMYDVASSGGLGEGIVGSGDAVETDDEDDASESDSNRPQWRSQRKSKKGKKNSNDDLEDLGVKARSKISSVDSAPSNGSLAIDSTTSSSSSNTAAIKAMVPKDSPTYAALTKQGYTIVGSHSGVKICRWTKSALRGRGSCYKFSFYGIKSHLCMETTPSLSCSNKCVFCWRHGTNPVGTTWRWQVDPPDMIFEGAKQGHYQKIRVLRGLPGIRAERYQEAMRIRHCALSLVGEPIFYPHINEFLALLHKERISSFLVCNAQHPDQLSRLQKATQLYVSIDASNAESLRKIDRPLHRDYWQRFTRCLDILCEKRFSMRTVFRLTLVKGFNIEDEVEGYADLIARGLPCFIEIKGVTYCGTASSAGAGLTMQNVPFYTEIVTFVEALNQTLTKRGLDYGIAAEHAHSCCVLIASKRFLIDGKWHTLIDYDRFFQCLDSGEDFRPEDYMGPPTPEWATWGQGGFDPADERVYRKGKGPKKGEITLEEKKEERVEMMDETVKV